MRRRDAPDRRRSYRRKYDPRAERILAGRCDQPTWSIGPDGLSQIRMPCGLCLPCRVEARLGKDLAAEVQDELRISHDRRLFNERRRSREKVRTERRKPSGRRRQ